jgi:integrase/recombinase XerD
MRWSGLAIRDAATLERSRLDSQNRLILHRAKTDEPVFVELPANVADELRKVPNGLKHNPRYFFWSGNGLPKTVVADWQRVLRRLFKLAGLKHQMGHLNAVTLTCSDTHTAFICWMRACQLNPWPLYSGTAARRLRNGYYKSHTQVTQQRISKELRLAWKAIEKRQD